MRRAVGATFVTSFPPVRRSAKACSSWQCLLRPSRSVLEARCRVNTLRVGVMGKVGRAMAPGGLPRLMGAVAEGGPGPSGSLNGTAPHPPAGHFGRVA
jgi:hypothetical protein